MRQFETQRQIKSRFYSKATVFGLCFVVIFLANGVWKLYLKEKQSEVIRAEAEGRLSKLRDQKANIDTQINRLSDEGGVEEEIREKFNVVKPGEHVVVIVNPEEATSTEATSTGFFGSLWQKIWR